MLKQLGIKSDKNSSPGGYRVPVNDKQVRKLMEEMSKHGNVGKALMKAGMNRKTGRKYLRPGAASNSSEAIQRLACVARPREGSVLCSETSSGRSDAD